MKNGNTTVLYRNNQWMILREKGGTFLVEIDLNYPNDLEGGYSISAQRLARATASGHTEIFAICEKSWVNVDDLQDATERAFRLARVKPNYDLAKAFADARRYYVRPKTRQTIGAPS